LAITLQDYWGGGQSRLFKRIGGLAPAPFDRRSISVVGKAAAGGNYYLLSSRFFEYETMMHDKAGSLKKHCLVMDSDFSERSEEPYGRFPTSGLPGGANETCF